jgi:hypothetical protein
MMAELYLVTMGQIWKFRSKPYRIFAEPHKLLFACVMRLGSAGFVTMDSLANA